MSLSVCMIVKDEEPTLERLLKCVEKFADEIIIVDTGSKDRSLEIARSFTDKVYTFTWQDDFSLARNFSLSKSTKKYQMWLDADDVITDENAEKIRYLKGEDFDLAYLKYCTAFYDDVPTFVYFRERIFRREKNFQFVGCVHEVVEPRGRIIYSDIEIHHRKVKKGDPLRNLNILQKQLASGICLDERQKFYFARELFANNMPIQAVALYEEFLNGDGWKENKIQASLDLYHVYKILGDDAKATAALLGSLYYGYPTPELCCNLGEHFLNNGDSNSAIFWYKTALGGKSLLYGGGFFNLDYCGFIPNMQLCLIYDRLGDRAEAERFNEAAGSLKPNHPAYLKNKSYFNSLKRN